MLYSISDGDASGSVVGRIIRLSLIWYGEQVCGGVLGSDETAEKCALTLSRVGGSLLRVEVLELRFRRRWAAARILMASVGVADCNCSVHGPLSVSLTSLVFVCSAEVFLGCLKLVVESQVHWVVSMDSVEVLTDHFLPLVELLEFLVPKVILDVLAVADFPNCCGCCVIDGGP
jgi:hypothetical protein